MCGVRSHFIDVWVFQAREPEYCWFDRAGSNAGTWRQAADSPKCEVLGNSRVASVDGAQCFPEVGKGMNADTGTSRQFIGNIDAWHNGKTCQTL
jgi:hypothetical protein